MLEVTGTRPPRSSAGNLIILRVSPSGLVTSREHATRGYIISLLCIIDSSRVYIDSYIILIMEFFLASLVAINKHF